MGLFDTKTYNLDTNDSIDIVLSQLRKNVDKERFFRFDNNFEKPFKGTILENKFKIQRLSRYRNSWIPIIEGTISSKSYGTNIKVKMTAHPIVQIFMTIWILLLIGFVFMIFISSIKSSIALIGLPVLIVIGLFGLTSSSDIKKEWMKSESLLIKIIRQGKDFNPNFKIDNPQ